MNIFSTWTCPQCKGILGWLCKFCVYCEVNNKYETNPDIKNRIEYPMTPQEELFKTLFNRYTIAVTDKTNPMVREMSDLEIRAWREELCTIAFEAKAAIGAADEILKERKPKGPQGFKTSVNDDSATREAINSVKKRVEKMSKMDKIKEKMLAIPGMDPSYVERLMSNKNILDEGKKRVQNHSSPEEVKKEETKENEPSKPIFNPFEKKEE